MNGMPLRSKKQKAPAITPYATLLKKMRLAISKKDGVQTHLKVRGIIKSVTKAGTASPR
jgi:hypothetical protein